MPADDTAVEVAEARAAGLRARLLLNDSERGSANQAIAAALAAMTELRGGGALGSYCATAKEADPAGVHPALRSRDWIVHLPRIDTPLESKPESRDMSFVPVEEHTNLNPNRFGILEPTGPGVSARSLDVLLLPCVAVDGTGNRVGFGAGYYDRALERTSAGLSTRPLLIGVCFEVQVVERIAVRRWDVPLDIVVTDRQVMRIG